MPALFAPLLYLIVGGSALGGSYAAVNNLNEPEPTALDSALPSTLSLVKLAVIAAVAFFGWRMLREKVPKRKRGRK